MKRILLVMIMLMTLITLIHSVSTTKVIKGYTFKVDHGVSSESGNEFITYKYIGNRFVECVNNVEDIFNLTTLSEEPEESSDSQIVFMRLIHNRTGKLWLLCISKNETDTGVELVIVQYL